MRNEADNIAPVIAEIAAALDGRWNYEIIYVNDGSTDATAERLAAVMKSRPQPAPDTSCDVGGTIGSRAQRRSRCAWRDRGDA